MRAEQFPLLADHDAADRCGQEMVGQRLVVQSNIPGKTLCFGGRACCSYQLRMTDAGCGVVAFELGIDLAVSCDASDHESLQHGPAKFVIDHEPVEETLAGEEFADKGQIRRA